MYNVYKLTKGVPTFKSMVKNPVKHPQRSYMKSPENAPELKKTNKQLNEIFMAFDLLIA